MLFILLACSGESSKESSSDAPPINQGDDTASECSGADPVATALRVEDGGTITDDKGTWSAFTVNADVEDDDGDLTKIGMDLWWDETVDGVVDTSGGAPIPSSGYHPPNATECHLFMTTYGLKIPVDNLRFMENTTYEFAAILYDAANLPSNVVIGSGTTPAAL